MMPGQIEHTGCFVWPGLQVVGRGWGERKREAQRKGD